MENCIIILWRIFVMFLLMTCGYILSKLKFFDENATAKLSALLTKFIIPTTIIASFVRQFNKKEALNFISAFFIDLGFFILCAIIASFIFKKRENGSHKDLRICSVFVNNGFFALPLISALFGDFGLFIGSAHLCAMNIFLWTYGVFLYKGKKEINIKSILFNPGLVATVIGFVIFISSAVIPANILIPLQENTFTSSLWENIVEVLNMIKNVNTPLAMLVAGAWLEKAGIKKSFVDLSVWKVSAVRMIFLPIILLLIIWIIPISKDVKTVIMLGSTSPTAITAATFSQISNGDYIFCTKAITVTTIISAITMPLFVALISLC